MILRPPPETCRLSFVYCIRHHHYLDILCVLILSRYRRVRTSHSVQISGVARFGKPVGWGQRSSIIKRAPVHRPAASEISGVKRAVADTRKRLRFNRRNTRKHHFVQPHRCKVHLCVVPFNPPMVLRRGAEKHPLYRRIHSHRAEQEFTSSHGRFHSFVLEGPAGYNLICMELKLYCSLTRLSYCTR